MKESQKGLVKDYDDKSSSRVRLGTAVLHKTVGAEIEVLPKQLGLSKEQFAKGLFTTAPEFEKGEFVLKEDASLDNQYGAYSDPGDPFSKWVHRNGLEINTGIMSVDFSRAYDWERMFWALAENCFSIEGSMDVGLHIHADKLWGKEKGPVDHTLGMALTYMVDTMPISEVSRVFGRITEYADGAPEIWVYSRQGFAWVRDLSVDELRDEELQMDYLDQAERNQLVNVLNKDTVEFRGFLSPRRARQFRYALELVTAMMEFATQWCVTGDSRLPTWTLFLETNPRFSREGFLEQV